jgi:hypothetical protein
MGSENGLSEAPGEVIRKVQKAGLGEGHGTPPEPLEPDCLGPSATDAAEPPPSTNRGTFLAISS